MNKLLKSIFVCAFLAVILIACSKDSEDNQDAAEETNANDNDTTETETSDDDLKDELNIAYSAQPATIDPHITTAVATSDIMRGVYETLLATDENYEVKPMLAESYEVSDDGKEITFKIRQGVKFHNGKEMTVDDVVASMERWRTLSSRATPFADAKFEATDDQTVVFTLPEPISTTLPVLTGMLGSFAAIMPAEVIEAGDDSGVTEFIGTGPFQFDEWRQDSYVKLSKFDDYQAVEEEASGLAGKKEALVEEVYFHFVTDASTRVAGVLSGEYDIVHATPYDQAETIENSDVAVNHSVPGSTYIFLFNKEKEIFKDVRVRKAIRQGLDVASIMHGTFGNEEYYTLNHNLVMPYLTNLYNTDVGKAELEEYDLEAAKQELEELGVAGEEISLVTTRDYDDQYNASVVAQQQLEQMGLKVNLEVYDWPTLLDLTEDPEGFDLNIMGWGPQPEPTSYGFLRPGYDSGWIQGDEFFELIDDFRKQPSLEETAEAYEAIVQWLTDEVPFIKLGDSNRIATVSNKVNNFQFQDGFITWNISVSK